VATLGDREALLLVRELREELAKIVSCGCGKCEDLECRSCYLMFAQVTIRGLVRISKALRAL